MAFLTVISGQQLNKDVQVQAITLKQKPTFQNSIWHVNPN